MQLGKFIRFPLQVRQLLAESVQVEHKKLHCWHISLVLSSNLPVGQRQSPEYLSPTQLRHKSGTP